MKKPEKNQGFNGIRTRDLRDTGAMLYQLSYEATHWERGQLSIPTKNIGAGNIVKSMTSEGNSALLPANVDRRPPLLVKSSLAI